MAVAVAGCGGGSQQPQGSGAGQAPRDGGASQAPKDYGEVKMAIQFGTSYLPAIIVAENKLLEKRLPGVKVTQAQLGQGGSITEAMLAGSVDIGFMGLGPFFVGWAKGVDWKIAAAMEDMPIGLNTNRPDVKSVKDIKPTDKIALPGINSIQHIALAMEAKRQGMDPRAFDKQLVALPHPDGEKALLAKSEITFHYTAPPYLAREAKQPGIKAVVNSYDTLGGPHTFNVAVVTSKFYKERPEVYKAFVEAMEEAVELINKDPRAAAEVLIKSGYKGSVDEAMAELKDPQVKWTTEPHGLMKFATFMKEAGFIAKAPADWKEVTWPNLHGKAGN